MLSTILAKVTNIENLLAPAIHNLPDSEILDSKGVRLLTKMSDRDVYKRQVYLLALDSIFVPSMYSTFRLMKPLEERRSTDSLKKRSMP